MTYEDEEISPIDIAGERLLERLYQRDSHEGGMDLEATGPKGCGKTSLIFDIVSHIMQYNPEELVFMRDRYESPIQFNRFDNWRIFAQNTMTLKFRDIVKNSFFNIPVTTFNTYEEIYNQAKPGTINVVYLQNEYDWIRKDGFIDYIRRHSHRTGNKYLDQTKTEPIWKTIIFTEYEDVCPINESKPIWSYCKEFAAILKETRKGLTSTFLDTQNSWDCDHRVRGKITMKAYLKGAKVDAISPIEQYAVNSLGQYDGERQVLISWAQSYGKIRFKAFRPKNLLFEVIKEY
jgi:hypothetical protein